MARGWGLAEQARAQTYFVAVERLRERDAEVAEALVSVLCFFFGDVWMDGGFLGGGLLSCLGLDARTDGLGEGLRVCVKWRVRGPLWWIF